MLLDVCEVKRNHIKESSVISRTWLGRRSLWRRRNTFWGKKSLFDLGWKVLKKGFCKPFLRISFLNTAPLCVGWIWSIGGVFERMKKKKRRVTKNRKMVWEEDVEEKEEYDDNVKRHFQRKWVTIRFEQAQRKAAEMERTVSWITWSRRWILIFDTKD